MKTISSVNNPYIKELLKLKQVKNIKKYGHFLVEGYHLVNEANNVGLLKTVLITEYNQIIEGVENIIVNEAIISKLAFAKTPQNIIGVVSLLPDIYELPKKVLLLDDVQDPGNVGTLIRSAVAFGVDLVVLSVGTASIYNDKTIRSTQGAIFKVPIIQCELLDVISELKEKGIPIIGTSLDNGIELFDMKKHDSYALILGNEGQGISEEIFEFTDLNVYIQMNENVESLNVGVAGSIIMNFLNKG